MGVGTKCAPPALSPTRHAHAGCAGMPAGLECIDMTPYPRYRGWGSAGLSYPTLGRHMLGYEVLAPTKEVTPASPHGGIAELAPP